MKTANSTEELFDICHEAEILLEKEIKECQGYLTIFEPLTKVMFRWRREGKICHKKGCQRTARELSIDYLS